MSFEFRKRPFEWYNLIKPMLTVTILVYLVYHMFQGDRGLFALLHLQREIVEAEKQLFKVEEEHTRWQRRVGMMDPAHINKDMLIEVVQSQLGYVEDDDIVVIKKDYLSNK